MLKIRAILGVLVVATALIFGVGAPATQAAAPAQSIRINGIDLHGGMMYQEGGRYYLVGEEYACGFRWYHPSPWCGFGVSVAGKPTGPWSTPKLLFPTDETNPYTGRTFDADCGTINAHGCFEPRMTKRPDGAWLLWFDEVNGQTSATTSSIFAFGCNGPAGPCGTTAGTPHGFIHKPDLHQCNGTNGSVALGVDSTGPVLFCSTTTTMSEERLDSSWTTGTNAGTVALGHGLPGEGEGVYQDPASGTWILTYSDQPCGYCTGTSTSYATATSLMGPWTTPDNHGQGGWPADARRKVSASTCGGQTNTISVINGQAYQGIDLWTGSNNEAKGNLDFVPLTYTPTDGSAGDGRIWTPPLTLTC